MNEQVAQYAITGKWGEEMVALDFGDRIRIVSFPYYGFTWAQRNLVNQLEAGGAREVEWSGKELSRRRKHMKEARLMHKWLPRTFGKSADLAAFVAAEDTVEDLEAAINS